MDEKVVRVIRYLNKVQRGYMRKSFTDIVFQMFRVFFCLTRNHVRNIFLRCFAPKHLRKLLRDRARTAWWQLL